MAAFRLPALRIPSDVLEWDGVLPVAFELCIRTLHGECTGEGYPANTIDTPNVIAQSDHFFGHYLPPQRGPAVSAFSPGIPPIRG